MGNDTSKETLLSDDDCVPIKKRFSFSRNSHDNQVKDKAFDISEKELKKLREAYYLGSCSVYYPSPCIPR